MVEEVEEEVVAEEVQEDPVPEDHGSHGVPDRDRQATQRLRQLIQHRLGHTNHLAIKKLVKRNWIVKNWLNLMRMEEKIGANVLIQNQTYQQWYQLY